MRLFVALDLPVAVRDALAEAGAAADPGVWRAMAPESLHVTLAFLGAREPDVVALIEPIVAAESVAPRLALAGLFLLPPRRARILAAALDDRDGTLVALQARVSAALAAAGVYTPETRPFRPHVTLARLRPRVRAPREADVSVASLAFTGEAVTLYESRLSPKGARYEPLARAPLS